MPTAKEDKEFILYVVDLMNAMGLVHAKGMFGGHGIYLEGLMFALVADNVLYLKSDAAIEVEFQEKDLDAFKYNRKGKEYKMSYYQAPGETLEDAEEMKLWAYKAYGATLRAAAKKRK